MTKKDQTTETVENKETPKNERPKQPHQNGVTMPRNGTVTGSVWAAADEVSRQLGRPALLSEVREKLGNVNAATVSTQYAKWCRFHGVSREQRKEAREAAKPTKPADPEPAE